MPIDTVTGLEQIEGDPILPSDGLDPITGMEIGSPISGISRPGEIVDLGHSYADIADDWQGAFVPEKGKDYEPFLAENQGGLNQFWNAAAGGVLSGLATMTETASYILDVDSHIKWLKGIDEWERNWIAEGMISAKEGLSEMWPLYREDRGDMFDWDDPGWYAESFKGVLDSAVGFGGVGAGVGLAVQGITRAARLAAWMSRLKASPLWEQALNAGVTGSITNYGEGKIMGMELHDQIVENGKANGMPEEDAKKIADDMADEFLLHNRVFMVTDAMMVAGIFKGIGYTRKAAVSASGLKSGLKDFAKSFKGLNLNNPLIQGGKEAFEEVGQFGMQKAGELEGAERLEDPTVQWEKGKWMDSVLEHSMDEQARYEGMLGFFGGGPQRMISKFANWAAGQQQDTETRYEEQQKLIGDASTVVEDWVQGKTESQELQTVLRKMGQDDFADWLAKRDFIQVATSFMKNGVVDNLEKQLSDIANSENLTPEQIEAYGEEGAAKAQEFLDALPAMEKEWLQHAGYNNQGETFFKNEYKKHKEELEGHLKESTNKTKNELTDTAQRIADKYKYKDETGKEQTIQFDIDNLEDNQGQPKKVYDAFQKEVKELESYNKYKYFKDKLEQNSKDILKLAKDYNEMISVKGQKAHQKAVEKRRKDAQAQAKLQKSTVGIEGEVKKGDLVEVQGGQIGTFEGDTSNKEGDALIAVNINGETKLFPAETPIIKRVPENKTKEEEKNTEKKTKSNKQNPPPRQPTPPVGQATSGEIEAFAGLMETGLKPSDFNLEQLKFYNANKEAIDRALSGETEVIGDPEWEAFVDNGVVPPFRIIALAHKVKNNEDLTTRETAIFNDKTSEINDYIEELKSQESGTTASQNNGSVGDTLNQKQPDSNTTQSTPVPSFTSPGALHIAYKSPSNNEEPTDAKYAQIFADLIEDPNWNPNGVKIIYEVDLAREDDPGFAHFMREGEHGEKIVGLAEKVRNKEELTDEEVGRVAVRIVLLEDNGEEKVIDGEVVRAWLHDAEHENVGKYKWMKDLINLKRFVYEHYRKGNTIKGELGDYATPGWLKGGEKYTYAEGDNGEAIPLIEAIGTEDAEIIITDETGSFISGKNARGKIVHDKVTEDSGPDTQSGGGAFIPVQMPDGSWRPHKLWNEKITEDEAELIYMLNAALLHGENYAGTIDKDIANWIKNHSNPVISELAEIFDLNDTSYDDLKDIFLLTGTDTINDKNPQYAFFISTKVSEINGEKRRRRVLHFNATQTVSDQGMTSKTYTQMDKFNFEEHKEELMEYLQTRLRNISIKHINNGKYNQYLFRNGLLKSDLRASNGRAGFGPLLSINPAVTVEEEGTVATSVPPKAQTVAPDNVQAKLESQVTQIHDENEGKQGYVPYYMDEMVDGKIVVGKAWGRPVVINTTASATPLHGFARKVGDEWELTHRESGRVIYKASTKTHLQQGAAGALERGKEKYGVSDIRHHILENAKDSLVLQAYSDKTLTNPSADVANAKKTAPAAKKKAPSSKKSGRKNPFDKKTYQVPPKMGPVQMLKGLLKLRQSGADMEKFFENLGWTSDGRALWNAIKSLNPTILTGGKELGKDEHAKKTSVGKRKWVQNNLNLTGDRVIIERQKANYAGPNKLLIDDSPANVKKFIEAGGNAILHTTTKETLEQLNRMLQQNPNLKDGIYMDLDGVIVDLAEGVAKARATTKNIKPLLNVGKEKARKAQTVLSALKDQVTDPFLSGIIDFLQTKHFSAFNEAELLIFSRTTEEIIEQYATQIEKGDLSEAEIRSGLMGFYDGENNHIVMNEDFMKRSTVQEVHQAIVHEIIHASTAYPFNKDQKTLTAEEKQFVDAITGLWALAKKGKKKDLYGYTNPKEFMSEVMSNPAFRKDLADSKLKQILNRVINAIAKFFGFNYRQRSLLFRSEAVIKRFIEDSQRFHPQIDAINNPAIIDKLVQTPDDRPLNHYSSEKQVQEIVDTMTYLVVEGAEITDLESIKNIKKVFQVNEDTGHNLIYDIFNDMRIDHEAAGEFEMAKRFENILSDEEFPHFMDKVKDNLSQYGLRESITKEEEEQIAEGVQITPSWETNWKENATANIKLLVAFLPQIKSYTVTDDQGVAKVEKEYIRDPYLNLFTFGDFHKTWVKLQSELADIVSTPSERDVMKKMRNIVEGLAQYDPSLYAIVEFFDASHIKPFKKVQFHNAFSKTKIDYTSTFVTYDRETDSYSYNIGSSETTSDANELLRKWENEFLFLFTSTDEEGTYNLDKKALKQLLANYADLKKEVKTTVKRFTADTDHSLVVAELKKISDLLKSTGMNISVMALTRFIEQNYPDNPKGGINYLFSRPLARIYDSTSGASLARLLSGKEPFAVKTEDSRNFNYNVPIWTERSNLTKLMKQVTFFEESQYENMVLGQKGTKLWTYSHHDFITKVIAEFLEDPQNPVRLQELARLPYYKNSLLVQKLASDPEALESFRVWHYNNFKEVGEPKKDYKYTKMKKADDLADRYERTTRGMAPYMNAADKSRHLNMQIQGMMFNKTRIFYQDGSYSFDNTTAKNSIDRLTGYLIDELNGTRVAYEHLADELDPNRERQDGAPDPLPRQDHLLYYHYKLNENTGERIYKDKNGFPVGNAFKFYTFPELNYYKTERDEAGNPIQVVSNPLGIFMESTPGKAFAINDTFFTTETDPTNGEEVTGVEPSFYDLVRDTVEKSLLNRVETAIAQGIEEGVIEATNGEITNIAIDSENYNKLEYSKTGNTGEALRNMMIDITFNAISNNIEMTKLFVGDPRHYKSIADVKKRIPATIANGQDLAIYLNEKGEWEVRPFYKQATVANMLRPSEIYAQEGYIEEVMELTGASREEVEGIFEAYKEINTTDAQAWITLERAIEIYKGTGQWTDAHDEALPDIRKGKANFQQLKLFMQPLKGVHYELRIQNGMAIPSYSKYSQAVLFPSLIKHTELENLAIAMKEQEVDELIVLDGVKAGAADVAEWFNRPVPDIADIKNPIYSAVFFNTDELLEKYKPVHPNVYSHHSTIEFRPSSITNLPIGQEENIEIIGRLTTDKVDVLLVNNPLSKNEWPHITLSTAEGVKPMESNAEIINNQSKIISLKATIKGTIGVNANGKDITRQGKAGDYKLISPEKIKLNPVTLENRYWKLQQDLHAHGEHPTLVGSQAKKTTIANIGMDDDYGDGWTGRDLIEAAHRVDMTLSDRGKDFLLTELGWNEETQKIDNSKIYDLILAESKSDPFFYQEALQEQIPFDALPQYRRKIESRLAAMVTKRTVKLKQIGGSFIQTASAGFGLTEGTLMPENIKTGIIKLKREKKEERELYPMRVEDGKVKPGQVLLPHKMLRDIPGWHKMTGEQLAEKIDPAVLEAIGYRIPNQANSSNDVLEIVGFLPEEVGDTVVVYKEIPTKTGSDFDIDKMFIMLPEYDTDEEGNIVKVPYMDETNSTLEERVKAFAPTTPQAAMTRRTYRERFKEIRERKRQETEKQDVELAILRAKKSDTKADTDALYGHQERMWAEIEDSKSQIKSLRTRKRDLGTSASNTSEYTTVSTELEEMEELLTEQHAQLQGIKQARLEMTEEAPKETELTTIKKAIVKETEKFTKEREDLTKQMEEEIIENFDTEAFANLPIIEQNTDVALHNRRIDIWRRILLNKHKYLEVVAPLDGPGTITEKVKNQIKRLFPEPELENLEFYSLETQLNDKYSFIGGQAGIGVTANQLVDHALTQYSKQNLKLNIGIGRQTEEGYMDLSQIYDTDGNLIIGAIAAYLNAYVDIAKDPYITRGNHNLITANIVFMLLRAGVPFDYVNAFIAQPIIKEYVQATERDQASVTGMEIDSDGNKVSVVKQVLQKFGAPAEMNKNNLPRIDLKTISKEQLEESILNPDQTAVDPFAVLGMFMVLRDSAKRLSDSVLVSKADTKGVGKSLTDAWIGTTQIAEISADPDQFIGNWDAKFTNTMIGKYVENAPILAQDIFQDMFLSQSKGFKDLLTSISTRISGKSIKNLELAEDLIGEIYAGVMSRVFGEMGDNKNLFYGKNTMADRLRKMQNPNHPSSENDLIRLLTPGRKYKRIPALVGINNFRDTDIGTQNRVSFSWEKMYFHGTAEEKAFAKDLILYSYFSTGFKQTRNSFHTLIPHTILRDMGIMETIEHMKTLMSGPYSAIGVLEDQIFKNRWTNEELVPTVSKKYRISLRHENNAFAPSQMFGVLPGLAEHLIVGRDGQGLPIMKPYVSSTFYGRDQYGNTHEFNNLFQFEGMSTQIAESGAPYSVAIYRRANKLGYNDDRGSRIVEYNLDKTGEQSATNSNNPSFPENINKFVENRVVQPGALEEVHDYLSNWTDKWIEDWESEEAVIQRLIDCKKK